MEHLPGDILSEIVSHLPMKEAVRSSGISRGWRNSWKESSQFDLLDWESMAPFGGRRKAEMIVDRYLELHVVPIRAFRISCLLTTDGAGRLKRWLGKVHSISGDHLQELELDLLDRYASGGTSFDLFSIPDCHFRSLRSLTLRSFSIGVDLIDRLLRGCIWLEKLCLERCNIYSSQRKIPIQRSDGAELRLKHLRILQRESPNHTVRDVVDIHHAANLTSFEFAGSQKLRIDAPNLRRFKYHGRRQNFELLYAPSLDLAAIKFCNTESLNHRSLYAGSLTELVSCKLEGGARFAGDLLRNLSHVKSLEVDCGVLRTLVELTEKRMCLTPFKGLEKLVVCVRHPFEKWAAGLCGLLELCPSLQHLTVDVPPQKQLRDWKLDLIWPWNCAEEYLESSSRFPSCLINTLKCFKMAHFEEKKGEMLFIERLLKKGKALRSVELTTDDRKGRRWCDHLRSRLQAMPANSSSLRFAISTEQCNSLGESMDSAH